MVERQDIDALLISALYGELTPAEEARLTTHLESHPTDRTALDDLRGTREKLQQSRILTFQYEPPQSVSALLMQEASRRAPKKPESEGWFARVVRSFIQHPAMAAAAMIVVVVGASALVSRNSDQFAETPAVETSKRNQGAPSVAMEAPSAATPTVPADPANVDQFKVGLAEGEQLDRKADATTEEAQKLELQNENKKQVAQASPERDPHAAFYDSNDKGGDALGMAGPKPAKPAKVSGIEVRHRDAMPKDLDEAKPAEAKPSPKPSPDSLAKQSTTKATERTFSADADDFAANREAGYTTDGRARGGGAAPGATPTAPTTGAQQAPRTTTTPPPPPPVKAPRQEIATDATPTGGTATARDDQKAKEKAANDPNLAWAKDQHAALVTAVRANNCGRAANIALSIENRAPSYYTQNVASDRSVKECLAYINNERERDAEMRAQRAKKSQLKNAEPSAPKRAADQPSRAAPTADSK
jgi:hypothetical protein